MEWSQSVNNGTFNSRVYLFFNYVYFNLLGLSTWRYTRSSKTRHRGVRHWRLIDWYYSRHTKCRLTWLGQRSQSALQQNYHGRHGGPVRRIFLHTQKPDMHTPYDLPNRACFRHQSVHKFQLFSLLPQLPCLWPSYWLHSQSIYVASQLNHSK